MTGGNGIDLQRSDGETIVESGIESDIRLQFRQPDREKRRRHQPLENLFQHHFPHLPVLDYQLIPAMKQGSEKRESQKMIPVAMGEQQVIPGDFFLKKAIAQTPHAGPGIDNHCFSGFCSDLKAGRVPTIGDKISA
jgi:hypothetical protein